MCVFSCRETVYFYVIYTYMYQSVSDPLRLVCLPIFYRYLQGLGIHTYTYIYVYIFIYMHTHIYIYMYSCFSIIAQKLVWYYYSIPKSSFNIPVARSRRIFGTEVSRGDPAKWGQDDQWSTQGLEGQHDRVLQHGPHQQRGVPLEIWGYILKLGQSGNEWVKSRVKNIRKRILEMFFFGISDIAGSVLHCVIMYLYSKSSVGITRKGADSPRFISACRARRKLPMPHRFSCI